MRDPKRIERILALIEQAWTQYPDQRLGQLLVNNSSQMETNPFYYEDDRLEEALRRNLETSI